MWTILSSHTPLVKWSSWERLRMLCTSIYNGLHHFVHSSVNDTSTWKLINYITIYNVHTMHFHLHHKILKRCRAHSREKLLWILRYWGYSWKISTNPWKFSPRIFFPLIREKFFPVKSFYAIQYLFCPNRYKHLHIYPFVRQSLFRKL